jgi:RNA recognition motif-containing protein
MKLFVTNLPPDVTRKDLCELFQSIGKLYAPRIVYRAGRLSFMFLRMSANAGAIAIETLNGMDFKGSALRVERAFSQANKNECE